MVTVDVTTCIGIVDIIQFHNGVEYWNLILEFLLMRSLFFYRKRLLIAALTFFLVACSDNYNEEFITSNSTLEQSKNIAEKLVDLNLISLSYLKEDVFIVNNLIINDHKKTYGITPEGGFYENYYIQSEKNTYSNWGVITKNFIPSSTAKRKDVLELLSTMKTIGITDIHHDKTNKIFIFQWGSSVMNGYNGLILGDINQLPEKYKTDNFGDFKEINKGVFYFSIR